MKKSVFVILAFSALGAVAQTHVKPHVTKDGKFVDGHYRSAPNGTTADNFGTKGNTNPYNGKEGTVNPQPSCSTNSAGVFVCK
jgi:hypothetical protein